MRILIVEDENTLRNMLFQSLSDRGYVVEVAEDGEEGLYLGKEYPFDAAIVDLGLPKVDGLNLISSLREAGVSMPILILTARSLWQDKVKGLEMGGDDYLVKPFHFEELHARLNALIRRSSGWSQPVLACGPIRLDSLSQQVHVGGNLIELTAYEYKVLEYLMYHPGKIVSKTELTEHLYHQDFDRESNVIEVFIGRLRRKIDPHDDLKPIETLRGRGYRFTLAPDPAH